jgi:hypothetical protein
VAWLVNGESKQSAQSHSRLLYMQRASLIDSHFSSTKNIVLALSQCGRYLAEIASASVENYRTSAVRWRIVSLTRKEPVFSAIVFVEELQTMSDGIVVTTN